MCQLLANGAHVFSAVWREPVAETVLLSRSDLRPWTKSSLSAVKKPVSECFLHMLSQKSCPLNIHVFWDVTACYG